MVKIISDGAGAPANLETADVRAAGEPGYVAVFRWDYAAAEGYLPDSHGLTPQYRQQKERDQFTSTEVRSECDHRTNLTQVLMPGDMVPL